VKQPIKFGNAASRINNKQLEWLIESVKNSFKFTPDVIRKRGIFDSVSVERHNGNPASHPKVNVGTGAPHQKSWKRKNILCFFMQSAHLLYWYWQDVQQ